MKKNIILLFLFLSGLAHGQVYERHYKITSDDKDVGRLIATKNEDGDMTTYEISSDVTMRILFKVQLTNEIQAVFQNQTLLYSSATLYLNDNVYSSTKIEKSEGFYTVTEDSHETKIYIDKIGSSSAKLYFYEPSEESTSLSETEGEMKTLKSVGDKKYTLSEKGNEKSVSTYVYSSDEGLNKVEVKRPHLPELFISRVRDVSEIEAE